MFYDNLRYFKFKKKVHIKVKVIIKAMNLIINLFYLCHFILQSVVARVDSESKVRQIKLSSNCFSPFKHSLLNGCLTRVNLKGPVVLLNIF